MVCFEAQLQYRMSSVEIVLYKVTVLFAEGCKYMTDKYYYISSCFSSSIRLAKRCKFCGYIAKGRTNIIIHSTDLYTNYLYLESLLSTGSYTLRKIVRENNFENLVSLCDNQKIFSRKL